MQQLSLRQLFITNLSHSMVLKKLLTLFFKFPGQFHNFRDVWHVCTIFYIIHYIPNFKKMGFTSVHLSVTDIFHHIFHSNHSSHPREIWYATSSRGPTCCLPNSGLPVIYFLFHVLLHFWALHDTVHINHKSHPLETWYATSSRGPTCCLPNSGLPVFYFLFPVCFIFGLCILG